MKCPNPTKNFFRLKSGSKIIHWDQNFILVRVLMKIALIAAMAPNRVIGYQNQLPRHYSEDLQYFKKTTLNHTVVMGKNTFISLGKPLPQRRNVVITSQPILSLECYPDRTSFLADFKPTDPEEQVFIIGGAYTYQSFLPNADLIYLTKIRKNYQGDTFFPSFESDFVCISETPGQEVDFLIYQRK